MKKISAVANTAPSIQGLIYKNRNLLWPLLQQTRTLRDGFHFGWGRIAVVGWEHSAGTTHPNTQAPNTKTRHSCHAHTSPFEI